MKKSKLTPKQEKYVQGLIAGLSQRKAYREAYPHSKKWKDKTVDNRASELYNAGDVLGRYNELLEEHKNKALWTREDSINTLRWLIEKSIKSIENQDEDYVRQGTSNALMSAVQEINKMEGFHASNKVDIDANIIPVFVDDIGSEEDDG